MRIKNKVLVLAEDSSVGPSQQMELEASSNSKIHPSKIEEEKIESEKADVSVKDYSSHPEKDSNLKNEKASEQQSKPNDKNNKQKIDLSSANIAIQGERKSKKERNSNFQDHEIFQNEKKIKEKTLDQNLKIRDQQQKKNKFYKTRGGKGLLLEKEEIKEEKEKIDEELKENKSTSSEQPEKEINKETSSEKNQSQNKRELRKKENQKKKEIRKESSEKEKISTQHSKSDNKKSEIETLEKVKNDKIQEKKLISEKSNKSKESLGKIPIEENNESNKRITRSREKNVDSLEQSKVQSVPKKEQSKLAVLSSRERSSKAKESSAKALSKNEENNKRVTRSRDKNIISSGQLKTAQDLKNASNTISGDKIVRREGSISQNRNKEEKNNLKEITIAKNVEEKTKNSIDKNGKKVTFSDSNNKVENQESGRRRRLEFLEDSADKKANIEIDQEDDETFFERLDFLDDSPERKIRKKPKNSLDKVDQEPQLKIEEKIKQESEPIVKELNTNIQQVSEQSNVNVVKEETSELKEEFHTKKEEEEDLNPPNKTSSILKATTTTAKTKKKVEIKLPTTMDGLERPKTKRKNEISPPKMNEADLNAPIRTRSQRGIKPKSPSEKENIYQYDNPAKKINYKDNETNEDEEEYQEEEEDKENSEEEFVVRVRKPKGLSQNNNNFKKQPNNNNKQKGLKAIKEEKMEIEDEQTNKEKSNDEGESKQEDESEAENSMKSSVEEEYDPKISRKRRINFGRRKDGKRIKKESDSDREMKELTILNQNLIDYTLHYLF